MFPSKLESGIEPRSNEHAWQNKQIWFNKSFNLVACMLSPAHFITAFDTSWLKIYIED